MLAMHNLESAKKCFPSGGIAPYAAIENYLTDSLNIPRPTNPKGSPLGPDRQGMSWAYQILPYLEETAVYDLKTTDDLQKIFVASYHCPSKRGPTRHPVYDTELMDYAAAVPSRPRSKFPTSSTYTYVNDNPTWGTVGCGLLEFWGIVGGTLRFETPDIQNRPANLLTNTSYVGYMGVIVRSNYCATCTPDKANVGWYKRIGFRQITDGSSKTMVLGEKRLRPSEYEVGAWHDDYGLERGMGPGYVAIHDLPVWARCRDRLMGESFGYNFGAAHPGVMIAGFADASVHPIQFEIDRELFNRLGHRSDGEGGEEGAF